MAAAVPQIFVRNREGKVYGPIEPSTVELLIEGGVLQGLLQVSLDGEAYALPFRFPELRDFFPRHLWGDDNRREVALDAESEPTGDAGTHSLEDAGGGQSVGFGSTADLGEPMSPEQPPPGTAATASARPAAPRGSSSSAAPPTGPPVLGAPASRSPTGAFPAVPPGGPNLPTTGTVPVLTPTEAESGSPARTPTGAFPTVAPGATAAAPRPPAGTVPVLTPVAPAPVGQPPAAQPHTPTGAFPAAPSRGADRPPTGSFPVLTPATAETVPPAERRRSPSGVFPAAPPAPSDAVEGWGAAVPFALAPPGETRPPVQAPQPLSSTFTILRAELAETNALRIYAEGARTSATGLFFFDLPDRTITIYLRRGNPESAESTHGDDAIGPFLAANRLATAEQVSKGEREALKYGNDVLAALFTLGFVNPGLVFPALAQRAAALLLHAYLAPQGSFRFESVDLPPSKVVPLGSRWGLLAEVIRRVPLPDLKARLIDVRERPLVRRGTGDAMMDLRLTAQETRALSYFDGARSLANLAQSNAGEMDTILRVALLLREIDAASFPDVPPRAVPPPPPGRPAPPPVGTPAAARSTPTPRPQAAPSPNPRPAPVASRPTPVVAPAGGAGPPQVEPPRIAPVTHPGRPPSSPAAAAGELRELQARLERIRKETAFHILGVPEHADSAMVKAAYFKLAKQFHPDTVPAGASAELARVKAEIFAIIGEANRILSDDAGRARYKATLAEGGPADVDVQALLQAEETFNKGTALVRARRFAEAVKSFDTAITANAREGEFYAWRGYARFFTLTDKKMAAADALRDLNQALKLNERCAPAYYFIGQVHKLTGDSAAALKYFKKCVSIDANHVDALREIRLLAGK